MTIHRLRRTAATIALLLGTAPAANAQLTLRDALREADRSGYTNRIAANSTAAQHAQSLAPLKGVLPNVRLEAGYVRTTDPTAVFGTTLRQRAVTQANFDPARLNDPSATANYGSAIVLEQPLLHADAWAARRAALHATDATRATEQWTRRLVHVDVIRAYYGAVLARERVDALRIAARAAHAHVAQAESMVKQGLVTKSDALLASVRAGDVDAQLAEAEGAAATSVRQLAVILGRAEDDPPNDIIDDAKRLPSAERIRAEAVRDTGSRPGEPRADISAANDALAAAQGDRLRARSALLPRVNGFARYDWNSASSLSNGDRNWTIGVMASWNPFGGAGEIADVAATAAIARVAQARAEAARANAQLEIEQTRIALVVALTRLEIAERAAIQSVEAHRIVSRKYAGGLANVVELLDAQAAETSSVLRLSQARWSAIVAAAERRQALGLEPASLASLDDADGIAGRNAPTGR
jgi:outer membrane protein TolC